MSLCLYFILKKKLPPVVHFFKNVFSLLGFNCKSSIVIRPPNSISSFVYSFPLSKYMLHASYIPGTVLSKDYSNEQNKLLDLTKLILGIEVTRRQRQNE